MNGAQPQPSAAPQESPNPSPPPQSTTQPPPLTAAEQFAMLTAKPGQEIGRSVAPASAQPRSAYRAYKERTQISGRITNRGVSSVNALGTPLGRYRKILLDAIGSRWYAFLDQKRDLINIGTTRVVFVIDRDGRVNNLKVIENTANEASANVCIQSIQDAQLPPIPDDVAGTLPAEGLDMDIPFTIFAN
jgi:outer membrane biosynthesis protein TonB